LSRSAPEPRDYQKEFCPCAVQFIGPVGEHFSMVWEATNLSSPGSFTDVDGDFYLLVLTGVFIPRRGFGWPTGSREAPIPPCNRFAGWSELRVMESIHQYPPRSY